MIYVPTINESSCYYFDNNTTIIELDSNLSPNSLYNAKHISLDNHYNTYYKEIIVPNNFNCLNHNILTTNYYYRNDLPDIIIIFLFIMLGIIYIPYKLASRFWKWLK